MFLSFYPPIYFIPALCRTLLVFANRKLFGKRFTVSGQTVLSNQNLLTIHLDTSKAATDETSIAAIHRYSEPGSPPAQYSTAILQLSAKLTWSVHISLTSWADGVLQAFKLAPSDGREPILDKEVAVSLVLIDRCVGLFDET